MWEYMPVAHAYIILTYILCKMSHGVCNNRQVLIKNLMSNLELAMDRTGIVEERISALIRCY